MGVGTLIHRALPVLKRTSRTPGDLPVFNEKVLEAFMEGKHAGQQS